MDAYSPVLWCREVARTPVGDVTEKPGLTVFPKWRGAVYQPGEEVRIGRRHGLGEIGVTRRHESQVLKTLPGTNTEFKVLVDKNSTN